MIKPQGDNESSDPHRHRGRVAPLCQTCRACPIGAQRGLVDGARFVESAMASPALSMRLRPGQLLYGAGQRGDAVFVIHGGLVKETLGSDDGERVVRLVGPMGATGLAALIGEPHRHSALVIGDGQACRVPVERLREGLRSDPGGALELVVHWQGALDDVDRVIAAFASGPARARLARYILFLADQLGAQARLRRQEAAELIGVTPVSVTRLIGEFKRKGLVREVGTRLDGWDRAGLMALAMRERGVVPH